MIWDRWRRERPAHPGEGKPDQFEDLLESAPLVALLVGPGEAVLAANAEARRYFGVDASRLPLGLVEVCRSNALSGVLRSGRPDDEVRLVHQNRVVRTRVAPGPRPGEVLLMLVDVTRERRLETVRQEFVANLSHELRTPLTSLRLAVESLTGDIPAEGRRRFAERALEEVDHLAAIVDNLRQLAEIEAGRLAVDLEDFLLGPLLSEIAARLHIEGRLQADVPADLLVRADRAKLAQALGNLLDNAVKFAPSPSPIEVSAVMTPDATVIQVRDHGRGISPEHWDRVFERFYKVDPARTRDLPGSGLGLAITKHLVLAMGGKVWTRAAEGGGQVFAIVLPGTEQHHVS